MFPDLRAIVTDFNFSGGLPPAYKGPVLSCASVQSASGESGTIVLQEFSLRELTVRLCNLRLSEKTTIPFRSHSMTVSLPVILKNELLIEIKHFKRIVLGEWQYIFLYLAAGKCEITFEKEKEYLFFSIGYPAKSFREITPSFPDLLPSLLNKLKGNKAFVLSGPANTPKEIKTFAQNILNTPDLGAPTPDLLHKKADLFFYKLLINEDQKLKNTFGFPADELKKINAIADLLTSGTEERHSIYELAKDSHMNQNKLQKLFRKIYGSTIYHFQKKARMEKAKRIVLDKNTNNAIKYAALSAGYKSASTFTRTFRQYFGEGPEEMRKKNIGETGKD